MKNYYQSSLDHLFAELSRIGLILQKQICKTRSNAETSSAFQGLYISNLEIDTLLSGLIGLNDGRTRAMREDLSASDEEIRRASERIFQYKNASLERGISLRLHELVTSFNLSQIELDIILTCLIPEIDLEYDRLYAYLQDDATQKYPSIDLILDLLASSLNEKMTSRQFFSQFKSLFKYQILDRIEDNSKIENSILSVGVKVNRSIVDYLLENLDSFRGDRISNLDRLPKVEIDEIYLLDRSKQNLKSMFLNKKLFDRGWIFYLQGNCPLEKKRLIYLVCHEFDLNLAEIDFQAFLDVDIHEFEQNTNLLLRDAKLDRAAVSIDNFDMVFDDRYSKYAMVLDRLLARYPIFLFLSGVKAWDSSAITVPQALMRIQIPKLASIERLQVWKNLLQDRISPELDRELPVIASKFRFQRGQIHKAAIEASHLANWRNAADPKITKDDLYEACRLQSSVHLESLAHPIVPRRQWFDLVLPDDRNQQLKEICSYVKYRTRVYEQWGFDRKLSSGKGLTALFSGAPGTGKTMTAEVLAGDLRLELYKIDLSSVVSKYIGETEKHLSRIFEAGEASNAILFFDEADALFGKRTQVSDARDRYANLEVSYLLQRLEEYEGIVILATNFRRNMDDAFLRRLNFTVDFPLPAEKERRLIWDRILPEELPRSENLDLAFMARQFELAGGNIRNIALTAAFLAAEDNSEMTMNHLIRATQREYQKMGKVLREEEFGKYAELI